ncbi:hypothetical protein D3C86_1624600 [compost metagenome]
MYCWPNLISEFVKSSVKLSHANVWGMSVGGKASISLEVLSEVDTMNHSGDSITTVMIRRSRKPIRRFHDKDFLAEFIGTESETASFGCSISSSLPHSRRICSRIS